MSGQTQAIKSISQSILAKTSNKKNDPLKGCNFWDLPPRLEQVRAQFKQQVDFAGV